MYQNILIYKNCLIKIHIYEPKMRSNPPSTPTLFFKSMYIDLHLTIFLSRPHIFQNVCFNQEYTTGFIDLYRRTQVTRQSQEIRKHIDLFSEAPFSQPVAQKLSVVTLLVIDFVISKIFYVRINYKIFYVINIILLPQNILQYLYVFLVDYLCFIHLSRIKGL